MFNLGPSELIVIFIVALLVFGPKKLPELGRSLGKGLNEFRRASAEMRNSLEREMQTIEQDVQAQETPAPPSVPQVPETSVAHLPEAPVPAAEIKHEPQG